jgi:hypothetical protein
MDDAQRILLDEAITGRLRGSISPEEFRKTLNLARSHGGVGLSIRTMQHASDRLESVLALGHMGNVKDAIASVTTTATT